MGTTKTIVAVILGIAILLGVVILSKFVGDKIREKYLTPKTIITNTIPSPNLIIPEETPALKTSTYSAIPKTGPAEVFYLFSGLAVVSGIILRKISS